MGINKPTIYALNAKNEEDADMENIDEDGEIYELNGADLNAYKNDYTESLHYKINQSLK